MVQVGKLFSAIAPYPIQANRQIEYLESAMNRKRLLYALLGGLFVVMSGLQPAAMGRPWLETQSGLRASRQQQHEGPRRRQVLLCRAGCDVRTSLGLG